MAESRLADIYRKELKTKGLLGALVSASGARLKEKTDIRGLLPQTGVSGAAFEKMFGKRYKYGGNKEEIRNTGSGGSDSSATKSMEEKLTRIGVDMKIMAKNSVVFPAMARDMNLMRMNMQKMVKISGGTPSTKSDMFFKRAGDREAQYEGQFKKSSGGLTPTPVGGKKEEGGGGFLSTILDFFKGGLGNIVDTLLGALIKGGLIAGFLVALGKYFNEKEFRDSVNSMLDTIFKTVFGDDYKKNLQTGAAILAGAYIAFQASLALLEAAMFAAARRISMLGGGPGLPGGPSGPGGKMSRMDKLAIGATVAWAGAEAYQGLKSWNWGKGNTLSEKEKKELADNTAAEIKLKTGVDPTAEEVQQAVEEKQLKKQISDKKEGMAVSGAALSVGLVAGTVSSVTKVAQGVSQTALNVATTPPTSKWGKFLAWVAKKSPKLFARIGMKLAAAGAMATVPFAGWISAAITIGFTLWDAWTLYELWQEYNNLPSDETSPTPVDNSVTADLSGGYDANGVFTGVSPSPATSIPMPKTAAPTVTPGGVNKRGGSTSPTPSTGTAPSGGPIDPSKTTFADLTVEQQDAFFAEQRKQEGFKPGSLSYDLNNPGNMLYAPWQKKYGGELDTTGRGIGSVKGKFARFPTLQAGVDAQRALWLSPAYANLPLDKALNKWVTGNPNSDMDPNMQAKNTGYKNAIYAAIGSPEAVQSTLAAAPTSSGSPKQETQVASSGNALVDLFNGYSQYRDEFMKQSGGNTTNVNAPVTNVAQNNGGGGGGNVNPYNTDMMKYLLRPVT
jgi:hypothetical protein